ncbi:hypothetical protein [Burkholderia mayonis]|uniref:Uncharacterized protein n=1 Tax=Burkholderia mayonis TaxID=1385591 RepID=A0A1B4FS33_9BURK|nr:hypothetical protein [Burkholderia mayonis]AOJ06504.1 hypothetical protein WS71_03570 [Burkholderia mayonis]KVE51272.1 hypothetical protein WS71_13270 [Burkholderia mayonis]
MFVVRYPRLSLPNRRRTAPKFRRTLVPPPAHDSIVHGYPAIARCIAAPDLRCRYEKANKHPITFVDDANGYRLGRSPRPIRTPSSIVVNQLDDARISYLGIQLEKFTLWTKIKSARFDPDRHEH